MSEEQFRVRFEQEDGRGEIVNEKGVELTAREVVGLLNQLHQENNYLSTIRRNQQQMILKVIEENEQLKKQRYDLYMDIARLVKENEQLREDFKESVNDLIRRLDAAEKEKFKKNVW